MLPGSGGDWNRMSCPSRDQAGSSASIPAPVTILTWLPSTDAVTISWCSGFVSYQKGVHAPGIKDWQAATAATHHLMLSHGLSLPVIRRNSAGSEVGITLNLSPSVPASDTSFTRARTST